MKTLPPTTAETVYRWVGRPYPGAPSALFALDETLGAIVRTTRTPIVGQMRLTWWRDALHALDDAPAPAHPVLRALHAHVLPQVTGATLARMTDGWELLVDEAAPDDAGLQRYAQARGSTLFDALSGSAGDARVAAAGAGWALADLAAHVSDAALAQRAGSAARATLAPLAGSWRGPARVIGALAADARLAVEGRGVPGGPRRSLRALRLLATGR